MEIDNSKNIRNLTPNKIAPGLTDHATIIELSVV